MHFKCTISVNCRVLICCTCNFWSGFLLFVYLASSVCKSLQCLMSALHKEAKVITNSGSLVQLCCREGGTMQTNITGMCGECLQCGATLGMSEPKVACASWVYTAQVLSCSARVLSQVGPAFHAPPRSKQLRFSHTPKGTDLDGLCILCPSRVQAAQMTRSLASALSYVGHASYSPRWFQPLSFPGVPREPSLRCAVCLFWGSDLRP